ncbi:MAG: nuclear transport factor 2 family protein [Novosphingobium sp.]|nr:nuclear transport factor 2 family protein [Novosphingobium sp.]
MANDDLARKVEQLERRLAEAEARLAVQQVITTYGLAADTNDIPAMMALWTDDCVIEIDGTVIAQGREQSRRIIESEVHQSIQPYSAHVMGPFRIDVIDADHAVATGYQTVYVREGRKPEGRSQVWRQSFGRWELRRTGERWEIARRQSRAVTHPGIREIVEPTLRGVEKAAN